MEISGELENVLRKIRERQFGAGFEILKNKYKAARRMEWAYPQYSERRIKEGKQIPSEFWRQQLEDLKNTFIEAKKEVPQATLEKPAKPRKASSPKVEPISAPVPTPASAPISAPASASAPVRQPIPATPGVMDTMSQLEASLKELFKKQYDLNIKMNREGLSEGEASLLEETRKEIADKSRALRQLKSSLETPEETMERRRLEEEERRKFLEEQKKIAEIEKTKAEALKLQAMAQDYISKAQNRKQLSLDEQIDVYRAKKMIDKDYQTAMEEIKALKDLQLAAMKGDIAKEKQLNDMLIKDYHEFMKNYNEETKQQIESMQRKIDNINADLKIIADPNSPDWQPLIEQRKRIEKEKETYLEERERQRKAITLNNFINQSKSQLEKLLLRTKEGQPQGEAKKEEESIIQKQERLQRTKADLEALFNSQDQRWLDLENWLAQRINVFEEGRVLSRPPQEVMWKMIDYYKLLIEDAEPDSLRLASEIEEKVAALLGQTGKPFTPLEKAAIERRSESLKERADRELELMKAKAKGE